MLFFETPASAYEKYQITGNLSHLYQMGAFDATIVGIYFAILVILSFYGLHRYLLVFMFHRYCRKNPVCERQFEEPPRVTVQIPSYNEMYVIERVIDAVCSFDYPRDRFEVQVLDDSTDETQRIAQSAVSRWRSSGLDIRYIHRADRIGFKAGALENGLRSASGEFVAVFDADFIPHSDFLQRTIHYFTDPRIGMVQGRWSHLNRAYSFLTRIQAIYLDGHFMLESFTRSQSGRFFNFNGTAGIIRRSVIEEAGGWQHDTLTEDLDLSYRAQLKGWKFLFLPDLPVPAELPVEMNSFKVQQCRWAKGAMQTAKKLLPMILKADLSAARKMESWYHLTGNITYPLMLMLTLILFPAMIVRFNQGVFELLLFDLPLFILAFSSVTCFYITAQKSLHRDWLKRIVYLPGLMAVGIGMSVAGTKAVLEGVLGIRSAFVRTPKFSVRGKAGDWRGKRYRGHKGILPIIELTLGIYFGYVTYYAWDMGIYGVIPFLLLFLGGYLYMGLMSLAQDRGRRTMALPLRARIYSQEPLNH